MRHDRLILALGGYVTVAHRLKRDPTTVFRWQQRGIPPQHWPTFLRLAERAGIKLTIYGLQRNNPRRRAAARAAQPITDEALAESVG